MKNLRLWNSINNIKASFPTAFATPWKGAVINSRILTLLAITLAFFSPIIPYKLVKDGIELYLPFSPPIKGLVKNPYSLLRTIENELPAFPFAGTANSDYREYLKSLTVLLEAKGQTNWLL